MRRPFCMVCLAFVLAVFVFVAFKPPKTADLNAASGKTVCLAGKIYHKEHRAAPSGGSNYIIYLNQIAISGESISLFQEKEQITGVMCYMEEDTELPLGSVVAVKGKLQEFMRATNPGEFDSRQYYQILKLDFKLKNTKVIKSSKEYNKLQESLYSIKEHCKKVIGKYYDSTDAGIMNTVLLGDKNSLEEEIKEQYKRNGIIHIMAISGLHISMLGLGLVKIQKKIGIPGTAAGITAVMFMWCYGAAAGMSASANRAIIMFGMKMAAEALGRTYDMLTALALSAVLILAEQPLYVRHSGFLLSFGAVMGIGAVLPVLEEEIRKKGSRRQKERNVLDLVGQCIKKGLLSGAAVLLVTFPIQIFYYYQYPIYSIFLNLWIIPLMTLVMLSGIGVLLIGTLSALLPAFPFIELAGGALAYIGHLILQVYTLSCTGAESMPGTVVITGQPKEIQVLFYYAVLLVLLAAKECGRRRERESEVAVPIISCLRGVAVIVSFMILLFRPERGMEITFLDVGQGDCIYIRDERGNRYLMDGGSTSRTQVGTYQIAPFLKRNGVDRLEAVFVTHGDKDHYSGIEELLADKAADRIRIKYLILPKTGEGAVEAERDKEEACVKLAQLAEESGITVVYAQAGDKITNDILKLECLNPAAGSGNVTGEDSNEQSQVWYLTYKDFTALFTGDITGLPEKEMEKRFAECADDKKLTVLKVAHHGSAYSTGRSFLEMAGPAVSVISCGENNRYGHPHEELLNRLSQCGTQIYKTPESGAITIWSDGKRVKIKEYLVENF